MEKTVEAYFCNSCSPASGPDYEEVKVKFIDGEWQTIHRMDTPQGESVFCSSSSLLRKARIVLEHYLGQEVEKRMVERLVDWPGHDLCRLTPKDLGQFVAESAEQLDLFSGVA